LWNLMNNLRGSAQFPSLPSSSCPGEVPGIQLGIGQRRIGLPGQARQ
jgi:hypothetical protein